MPGWRDPSQRDYDRAPDPRARRGSRTPSQQEDNSNLYAAIGSGVASTVLMGLTFYFLLNDSEGLAALTLVSSVGNIYSTFTNATKYRSQKRN